ncbi:hypothetical protein [Nonomuraea sp. NPDC049129]|uniref:hypothetical protein n=1 Tax=Nonomuraea sp. NPDC049129 TaxID=3155272 RepID=UPI0033E59FAB
MEYLYGQSADASDAGFRESANAHLAMHPFDAAYFENNPQVMERVKRSLAKPETLVSVQAFASG